MHRTRRLQVVPETIDLDPAGVHVAGVTQVVPRAAIKQPTRAHHLGGRVHVVPVQPSVGAVAKPAAQQHAGGIRVHPLAGGALEEPGHHVTVGAEAVVGAVDREPAVGQVGRPVGARVPPATASLHPMAARGVGAERRIARTSGGQVDGHRRRVVEAVIPAQHVRVGHNGSRAALIHPRAGDFGERNVHLVAVLAIFVSDLVGVGEYVSVEP